MKTVLSCSIALLLLLGSLSVASAIVLGGVPSDLKRSLSSQQKLTSWGITLKKAAPEGTPSEKEKNKIDLESLQENLGEVLDEARSEHWYGRLLRVDYMKPSIVLPAFKIYPSKKNHTIADVSVMSGIGGGISFGRYDRNSKVKLTNGEPDIDLKTSFSFSPLTVMLRKDVDKGNIDLSCAMTGGCCNDVIMIGLGYDLGEVQDRNRQFVLLSIGASF